MNHGYKQAYNLMRIARGGAGESRNTLPELPLDVWRMIWGQLSASQRVQASGVNREWRWECVGKAREEAVTLVTAPDTLADNELRRPQQALRGVERLLRGENPLTGTPVPEMQPWRRTWPWGRWEMQLGPDFQQSRGENGADEFLMLHLHEGRYIRTIYTFCEAQQRVAFQLLISWIRPTSAAAPRPGDVDMIFYPETVQEGLWMQGLLLALSGGSRGLLRSGKVASIDNSLALCKMLNFHWRGPRPTTKALWPRRRVKDSVPSYWGPDEFHQSFPLPKR